MLLPCYQAATSQHNPSSTLDHQKTTSNCLSGHYHFPKGTHCKMFLELAGYWWFEFATSWGIGLERDLEISPVLYLAPPKTTKVVNLGPPLEKNIILYLLYYIQSVQFSHSVMFHSLWPHGLQHTRLPCPSATPRAFSNSCPSSQWCHPTTSSSVVPFSSCLQPFPASGSFPMSQFFTSDGPNIGFSASASVLPVNIQDQFPLGWDSLISLQSKGLSRVFSNTTV